MKKIILFTLASTLSLAASAQSWEDALQLSDYLYGGTARSVAMGNAFTAVGGDLGSIGINPAGSAITGYSQMALTTGLSISSAYATSADRDVAFGDRVQTVYTRFKVPNIGFVLNIDTGNRRGIKRFSLGFVSNSTNDYTSRMYATGINSSNSFCGAVASSAEGYPEDVLSGSNRNIDWWNLDSYASTYGLDWRDMVAYRSGIFGSVNGRYLGLTDWDKDGKNTGVLAPLYQKYGVQSKGYKHDYVINVAFNVNDEFYFGGNLGIVSARSGYAEYWYETPNNAAEFPTIPFDTNPDARFNYLEMKRIFDTRATGAYFKVGALWAPRGTGLRLGAALQTPTILNIDTRMAWYGKASLTGVSLGSVKSPEWDDGYALVAPARFNAGIAYTFGKVGLLSVDYEVANYRHNRFRSQTESQYYYANSHFDNVNADITDILGVSHMLRVGAEVNVAKGVAVRAGYGLTTAAQHNYLEWVYSETDHMEHLMVYELSQAERIALMKQYFSCGVGFNHGPFFTDVAFRYRMEPNEYFIPYKYYDYNGTEYTDKYEVTNAPYAVPEVTAKYNRFEVMLTLGMRF